MAMDTDIPMAMEIITKHKKYAGYKNLYRRSVSDTTHRFQ